MEENRYAIDADRISVLSVVVLWALALMKLVSVPEYTLEWQVSQFYFSLGFDLRVVATVLAAILTAAGMDWLLRGHPSVQAKRTIEHWLLPTLTTFIFGVSLSVLPDSSLWWVVFLAGALLLIFVFWAEYVVVEPADARYAVATVVLTALIFAIFLIMVVALRYGAVRLLLFVPVVFMVSFFVVLRTIHLKLGGQWLVGWAAGVAVVMVQLVTSLHYLPLSPMRFGIVTLGILYALTNFSVRLLDGMPVRRAVIEPGIMLSLFLGLAVWFQ